MPLAHNVLVVEPCTDLRDRLRTRLEELDRNVISASTSAEAIALIEWHGLPDLILVATNLTYRPGSFFLDSLRELPFYVWTPTFQILAPGDAHLAGVAGFLELPVTDKKILSILNSLESRDQLSAEASPRLRRSQSQVNWAH